MPAVNPEILVWARETAGLTLQSAATKVGIRNAYGVTAVDRLAALERGETKPSRPVLVKMAQHYRRPLLAFYLAAPPPRGDRGADFRRLSAPRRPETDALIDALVRNVRSRQGMVRAVLEAEDEAMPLRFVGSLAPSSFPSDAMAGLRSVLGHDVTARDYYAQPGPREAFALLRSKVEAAGVFVILKGNMGNYQSAIEVDAFRGFAIADDIAPFVVINDNDSVPAWSFTLLHEVVHLLLGQTGLSGDPDPGTESERLCNNVAAEWMLPAETLHQVETERDVTVQQRLIGDFARPRNLSHTMVAYRLLRAGRINQQTFNRLRIVFREQWQNARDHRRVRAQETDGGPSPYVVRRHRVGPALLDLISRMLGSDALSVTKAARILDIKPAQVDKLLRRAATT